MDGGGSPEQGYVMRGGRMFTDEAYTCTYDLMSFIPSLADPTESVRDEMRHFNEEVHSHSNARLVADGKKLDTSSMGFSPWDRLKLTELFVIPEALLGAKADRRLLRAVILQNELLVHVVHHVRVPALA